MRLKINANKITAILSALLFFITNFTDVPAYAAVTVPATSFAKTNFPKELQGVQLPSELGKIEDIFQGASNKAVVIVQDAHAIPDAQRSIEKIIQYFQNQYGVGVVGVEGANAKLDPQIFKSFPDKELLKKVFDGYYEKGELTGSNAAAIFSDAPAMFHGVEDWALYEEGLGFYQNALKAQTELDAKLAKWETSLSERKKQVYSRQLIEVDQRLNDFQLNKGNLLETARFLADIQPPEKGTEIAALLAESSNAGSENGRAELEVKKIAQQIEKHLKAKLPSRQIEDDLKKFSAKQQEFQTGQMSPQAFALFLRDLSENEKLSVKVSRELLGGIRNQKMMRDIEGTKFFKSFQSYAQSVKDALITNEDQRKLDRETHQYQLVARLVKLELSHDDWMELKAHSVQRIADRTEINLNQEMDFLNAIRSALNAHFAFYENAQKRDRALLNKLLSVIERSGKKSTIQSGILIAGGFHAWGLTEELEKQNISYALIMPAMNHVPDQTAYLDQIKGNVSWKDYFKVENGKVNVYKAFVRSTRDKLLASSVERGADRNDSSYTQNAKRYTLKTWRDKIIRDLADKKQIQSANQYTGFIDEIVEGEGSGDLEDTPAFQEGLKKINRFVEGLQKLKVANQLTEPNVGQLFKPSTVQTIIGIALDPNALSSKAFYTFNVGLGVGETITESPASVSFQAGAEPTAALPAPTRSEVRVKSDGEPIVDASTGLERWNVNLILEHLLNEKEEGTYSLEEFAVQLNQTMRMRDRNQNVTPEILKSILVDLIQSRSKSISATVEGENFTITRKKPVRAFTLEELKSQEQFKGRPFIFIGGPSNIMEDYRSSEDVTRALLQEIMKKNSRTVIMVGSTLGGYGALVQRVAKEVGLAVISALPSKQMNWASEADAYLEAGSNWGDQQYLKTITDVADAIFTVEGYLGTRREFTAFRNLEKKAFRIRTDMDSSEQNLKKHVELALDTKMKTGAAIDTAREWGAITPEQARAEIIKKYDAIEAKLKKDNPKAELSAIQKHQKRQDILQTYGLLQEDGQLNYDSFYSDYVLNASNENKEAWLKDYEVITNFIEESEYRITNADLENFARQVHDNGYWRNLKNAVDAVKVSEIGQLQLGLAPGSDSGIEAYLTPEGLSKYKNRYSLPQSYQIMLADILPEKRLEFFARFAPHKDQKLIEALLGTNINPAKIQVFNGNVASWSDLEKDAENYADAQARLQKMRANQSSAMASTFALTRVQQDLTFAQMDYATAVIWRYKGHWSGKNGWEQVYQVRTDYNSSEFDGDRYKDGPIWQAILDRELELQGVTNPNERFLRVVLKRTTNESKFAFISSFDAVQRVIDEEKARLSVDMKTQPEFFAELARVSHDLGYWPGVKGDIQNNGKAAIGRLPEFSAEEQALQTEFLSYLTEDGRKIYENRFKSSGGYKLQVKHVQNIKGLFEFMSKRNGLDKSGVIVNSAVIKSGDQIFNSNYGSWADLKSDLTKFDESTGKPGQRLATMNKNQEANILMTRILSRTDTFLSGQQMSHAMAMLWRYVVGSYQGEYAYDGKDRFGKADSEGWRNGAFQVSLNYYDEQFASERERDYEMWSSLLTTLAQLDGATPGEAFKRAVLLRASNESKLAWFSTRRAIMTYVDKISAQISQADLEKFAPDVHNNGYWAPEEKKIESSDHPFLGSHLSVNGIEDYLSAEGLQWWQNRYKPEFMSAAQLPLGVKRLGTKGYQFSGEIFKDDSAREAFYLSVGKTKEAAAKGKTTVILNENAMNFEDAIREANNFGEKTAERIERVYGNQKGAIATAMVFSDMDISMEEMAYLTAVVWRYAGHWSGEKGYEAEWQVSEDYLMGLDRAEREKDVTILLAVYKVLGKKPKDSEFKVDTSVPAEELDSNGIPADADFENVDFQVKDRVYLKIDGKWYPGAISDIRGDELLDGRFDKDGKLSEFYVKANGRGFMVKLDKPVAGLYIPSSGLFVKEEMIAKEKAAKEITERRMLKILTRQTLFFHEKVKRVARSEARGIQQLTAEEAAKYTDNDYPFLSIWDKNKSMSLNFTVEDALKSTRNDPGKFLLVQMTTGKTITGYILDPRFTDAEKFANQLLGAGAKSGSVVFRKIDPRPVEGKLATIKTQLGFIQQFFPKGHSIQPGLKRAIEELDKQNFAGAVKTLEGVSQIATQAYNVYGLGGAKFYDFDRAKETIVALAQARNHLAERNYDAAWEIFDGVLDIGGIKFYETQNLMDMKQSLTEAKELIVQENYAAAQSALSELFDVRNLDFKDLDSSMLGIYQVLIEKLKEVQNQGTASMTLFYKPIAIITQALAALSIIRTEKGEKLLPEADRQQLITEALDIQRRYNNGGMLDRYDPTVIYFKDRYLNGIYNLSLEGSIRQEYEGSGKAVPGYGKHILRVMALMEIRDGRPQLKAGVEVSFDNLIESESKKSNADLFVEDMRSIIPPILKKSPKEFTDYLIDIQNELKDLPKTEISIELLHEIARLALAGDRFPGGNKVDLTKRLKQIAKSTPINPEQIDLIMMMLDVEEDGSIYMSGQGVISAYEKAGKDARSEVRVDWGELREDLQGLVNEMSLSGYYQHAIVRKAPFNEEVKDLPLEAVQNAILHLASDEKIDDLEKAAKHFFPELFNFLNGLELIYAFGDMDTLFGKNSKRAVTKSNEAEEAEFYEIVNRIVKLFKGQDAPEIQSSIELAEEFLGRPRLKPSTSTMPLYLAPILTELELPLGTRVYDFTRVSDDPSIGDSRILDAAFESQPLSTMPPHYYLISLSSGSSVLMRVVDGKLLNAAPVTKGRIPKIYSAVELQEILNEFNRLREEIKGKYPKFFEKLDFLTLPVLWEQEDPLTFTENDFISHSLASFTFHPRQTVGNKPVNLESLKPGDMLYFADGNTWSVVMGTGGMAALGLPPDNILIFYVSQYAYHRMIKRQEFATLLAGQEVLLKSQNTSVEDARSLIQKAYELKMDLPSIFGERHSILNYEFAQAVRELEKIKNKSIDMEPGQAAQWISEELFKDKGLTVDDYNEFSAYLDHQQGGEVYKWQERHFRNIETAMEQIRKTGIEKYGKDDFLKDFDERTVLLAEEVYTLLLRKGYVSNRMRSEVRSIPERDENILKQQRVLDEADVPGSSGSSELTAKVRKMDFRPDITDKYEFYFQIRDILKDVAAEDEAEFLRKVKAGVAVILKGNNGKEYGSDDIFTGKGREILEKLTKEGLNAREQAVAIAISFQKANRNYKRYTDGEISNALEQIEAYFKSGYPDTSVLEIAEATKSKLEAFVIKERSNLPGNLRDLLTQLKLKLTQNAVSNDFLVKFINDLKKPVAVSAWGAAWLGEAAGDKAGNELLQGKIEQELARTQLLTAFSEIVRDSAELSELHALVAAKSEVRIKPEEMPVIKTGSALRVALTFALETATASKAGPLEFLGGALGSREKFILTEILLRGGDSQKVIDTFAELGATDISQATGHDLIRWLYSKNALSSDVAGTEVKPGAFSLGGQSVSDIIKKYIGEYNHDRNEWITQSNHFKQTVAALAQKGPSAIRDFLNAYDEFFRMNYPMGGGDYGWHGLIIMSIATIGAPALPVLMELLRDEKTPERHQILIMEATEQIYYSKTFTSQQIDEVIKILLAKVESGSVGLQKAAANTVLSMGVDAGKVAMPLSMKVLEDPLSPQSLREKALENIVQFIDKDNASPAVAGSQIARLIAEVTKIHASAKTKRRELIVKIIDDLIKKEIQQARKEREMQEKARQSELVKAQAAIQKYMDWKKQGAEIQVGWIDRNGKEQTRTGKVIDITNAPNFPILWLTGYEFGISLDRLIKDPIIVNQPPDTPRSETPPAKSEVRLNVTDEVLGAIIGETMPTESVIVATIDMAKTETNEAIQQSLIASLRNKIAKEGRSEEALAKKLLAGTEATIADLGQYSTTQDKALNLTVGLGLPDRSEESTTANILKVLRERGEMVDTVALDGKVDRPLQQGLKDLNKHMRPVRSLVNGIMMDSQHSLPVGFFGKSIPAEVNEIFMTFEIGDLDKVTDPVLKDSIEIFEMVVLIHAAALSTDSELVKDKTKFQAELLKRLGLEADKDVWGLFSNTSRGFMINAFAAQKFLEFKAAQAVAKAA